MVSGSDFYVVIPLDVLAMGPYQVAVYARAAFLRRQGRRVLALLPRYSEAGRDLREEGEIGPVRTARHGLDRVGSEKKDDGSLASNLYSVFGVRSGTPGGEGSGTPGGRGLVRRTRELITI